MASPTSNPAAAPPAAGTAPAPTPAAAPAGVSQWQLIARKFMRNRLAIIGMVLVGVMYFVALFAEVLSPYYVNTIHDQYVQAPPQLPRFVDADGRLHLRPFVYGMEKKQDLAAFRIYYEPDPEQRYPLRLFVRGDSYRWWGLFDSDLHLLGVDQPGVWFPLGTDNGGKDLLSRIFYGARVSLTVGLLGVLFSIVLGTLLGIASGYFGGVVDNLIQRLIELMLAFPRIPLWMALAAALPPRWHPLMVYFGITIVLSLASWGGLARQLRAKTLALRRQEFVLAARASGVSTLPIIVRHLMPNTLSHIIVIGTLSIPFMILGETALSFLGLGIRPPMTSWGVLLNQAQRVNVLLHAPWLALPVFFVIVAVLAFNFLGDGLRDAADPYSL